MKQAEKNYMISDAAKQVRVEAHVLRYWEEELKLPIKRNEMGHRYYTEEDVKRFCTVKSLKEQGLQLKAIKNILKSGNDANPLEAFKEERSKENKTKEDNKKENSRKESNRKEDNSSMNTEEPIKRHVVMVNKGEFVPVRDESREAKSVRLQQLLQKMIMDAVRANNQELCDDLKENMLKELDYQFRLHEEREEEREEVRISRQESHYREIDNLLRSLNQKGKKSLPKEKKMPTESKEEEKPRKGFLRKRV